MISTINNYKANFENNSIVNQKFDNNSFYNSGGNFENFPNINTGNNQYTKNSFLKAFQNNNLKNINEINNYNSNNNTFSSNNKQTNYTCKPIQKEEGRFIISY
jgi:hypothetical protein